MEYKYIILSECNDFYMSDAICRELEKEGSRCYFNLRDTQKADKMPDCYDNIGKSTSIIAVVNDDFLSNHSFSTLIPFYSKKTSNDKVFIVQNGPISKYPSKWTDFRLVDANKGLKQEIVSFIKGETGHMKQDTSVGNDIDSTQNKVDGENLNVENIKNSNDDEDIYMNFVREVQEAHAKLPTVMTKKPTNTKDDSYFDRVSEAYLVPLYLLPFDRCASIPNTDSIFSNLIDPSLTIQRALRYLYGNGVPKDEKRAYSLFKKSVNEDNFSGEAKYCLGVCNEFGIGNDVDVCLAIQLYKDALDSGYMPAAARLGSIYYSKGDLNSAQQYIYQAKRNNDIESSYLLGLIAEDRGEIEDALEYYAEAAELGDAKAQNAIATMYYNGTGVSQNMSIALQWLEQSSKQGFIGALYNTVVYRLNGIDKAIPDMKDMDYLGENIPILDTECRKRHTVLKMPGIYYNFAILTRRRNAPIDTFKSWFSLPEYCKLPYVEEFYKHYEEEKKRRKRKAAGVSLMNGALSLFGNLNGCDNSKYMKGGGLFDKDREI